MNRTSIVANMVGGCAALVATATPSLGAINTRLNAYATRLPSLLEQTTETPFIENFDVENDIGGHGYAQVRTDFGAGIFTARTHGCVGPRLPVLSDNAGGIASANTEGEILTVRSPGLPAGTDITIILCYSITSDLSGRGEDLPQIFNDTARNDLGFFADRRGVSARHELSNAWQTLSGGGAFAGTTQRTETRSGTVTLVKRAGQQFPVAVSFSSIAQTAAGAGSVSDPRFPVSEGTAGIAITFGVMSITEGAHLEWRGATWTGSCDDSSTLVPDNPVPAPGAAALLALGVVGGVRRRRTRSR